MVQLKDDSSEASEISSVTRAQVESKPLWPYVLFAVAVGLVAIGAQHLTNSTNLKIGCPFHSSSSSEEKPENPHNPTKENLPAAENSQTADYDSTLYTEDLVYGSKKKLADVYKGRVVTKLELAGHGSSSDNPWVAVLGQIYDVTAGKRMYGSGGSYHFFAGKDGSRAYSTGQFDDEGLTDDLKGMTAEQIGEVYNWINIFSKKYPFVGRLEGPFFSAEGLPSPQWRAVEDLLSELAVVETAKAELHRKYPSCNSHYDQGAGKAEVWCTEKSGGITRSWMGVPRQLHLPGENVRCACIQDSLLSDPKLKEYPDCKPDSTSCKIKL
ncbi:hypothetical protein ACHWQZ_G012851 [Mnemiopsis leidyi]